MHYPLRSIETLTNNYKRYFGFESDEQYGDEVTYFDKPNPLLFLKPHFLYRVAKSLIAEFLHAFLTKH